MEETTVAEEGTKIIKVSPISEPGLANTEVNETATMLCKSATLHKLF